MASLLISLLISQYIAARSEEKPDLDLAKPILTAVFTKESTTQKCKYWARNNHIYS